MKQTYLKTDSFYKLPYCLIGPKNGRGRSCFFLICSVEGCTPITMPKLARETALIDFGRTVESVRFAFNAIVHIINLKHGLLINGNG